MKAYQRTQHNKKRWGLGVGGGCSPLVARSQPMSQLKVRTNTGRRVGGGDGGGERERERATWTHNTGSARSQSMMHHLQVRMNTGG